MTDPILILLTRLRDRYAMQLAHACNEPLPLARQRIHDFGEALNELEEQIAIRTPKWAWRCLRCGVQTHTL